MNPELERMWKGSVMAYLWHYPSINLDGMRKTTKNLVMMVTIWAEIWTRHLTNMSEVILPQATWCHAM
jgi:hypothetical protein